MKEYVNTAEIYSDGMAHLVYQIDPAVERWRHGRDEFTCLSSNPAPRVSAKLASDVLPLARVDDIRSIAIKTESAP